MDRWRLRPSHPQHAPANLHASPQPEREQKDDEPRGATIILASTVNDSSGGETVQEKRERLTWSAASQKPSRKFVAWTIRRVFRFTRCLKFHDTSASTRATVATATWRRSFR